LTTTPAQVSPAASMLDRQQRVIERAERPARDDNHGQAKVAGPIAHFVFLPERHAPATDTFHRNVGKAVPHLTNAFVEHRKIDGAAFRLRGDERRDRFAEMNGIDFIETETRADRFPKAKCILAITGGDGLERGRIMSRAAPRPHEPAGKVSLADAGVGTRHENVHQAKVEGRR
jgi:hypothetical protein